MDKAQGINHFWSGFGLPAYDENTVPQDAPLPRITYNVITDGLGDKVFLYGDIWQRSSSWAEVTQKAEEIEEELGLHGGVLIPLKNGILWVAKGSPFAQRMSDEDDATRRIHINISAEFLTTY